MKREILSIMSRHDASFKAISESQVALSAALSNLSGPGGQIAHVGSVIIDPVATDPCVTIKEQQAKLMNAAEVAAAKLQGILKKKV